ncbi:type II toxin-antitoxin system HicB family antitoxin [Pseudomonas sp. M30-35]|uniref:type II toxin-antitoxin system HicB family antitoxin n=1 Tax=Pseudomonas sp. M30-35 TaxID=1981174 RepID=UPI000B3C0B97|nr:type II toxin-antitoxin system HicB family antitoxin [Pseudomonas sp. M30-35]ARU87460.1 hypothetical protein B9K09_05505 [Pseudomonas sp. M30-35]
MTTKTLEYKGFQGSVDFDALSDEMYGKILHINDLVTYTSDSIKGLREEFEESVDDYLETCVQLGLDPEKPLSGSFNVRVGIQLHKELARYAARNGCSINEVVKDAVNCHVNGVRNEVHHHHYAYNEYESSEIIMRKAVSRPQLTVVK